MMAVPGVSELERICGGEGRDPVARRNLRIAYAVILRKVSIRLTWLLLHTRVSANQVTMLGVGLGICGAFLLAWNSFWPLIAALALLQLSFVIDYSDGEVARYRAQVEQRETNAGGAYLDWIGHYYVPAIAIAALAYGAFHQSGHEWLLAAALVAILSTVRIAYSARDHVLLGLYRDRPGLRDSDGFLRAVLARQGGDPEQLDLEAEYEQRREGARGSGVLWKRFTNLGQLLVFPGFVNLLTLAVAIDLLVSCADGNYPSVTATVARSVLVALLGIVHLVHQVRAAAQGFEVLRRL
ncbi:MAG: CDP-alcohol phosphatidyltransferase family protein [Solirubrobacterales bacterium]